MPVHRLFFALLPPPVTRGRIGALRDTLGEGHDPVPNERLHLALGLSEDFGAYPSLLAERMRAIGDAVLCDPFDLKLDRMTGSNRAVSLRPVHRCDGLIALQSALARGLRIYRIARADWEFSPYVKLAYRAGVPITRAIQPIEWRVEEFALVHSLIGQGRHAVLARWPIELRQGLLFG